MRHFFLSVIVAAFLPAMAHAVKVSDPTGDPLARASVFAANGSIAGVCGDDGSIPDFPASLYPLTIRYVGFEPAVISTPSTTDVTMRPVSYDLPELVIDNKSRNVLHLIGYMREYSTMATTRDTSLLYSEKVVDFMIPREKVKKLKGWTSPRVLARRDYALFTNSEGLDSVSNEIDDSFTWSQLVNIVRERIAVPDSLLAGSVRAVTVPGKYSPQMQWRRVGDDYTLDIDMLADKKDHVWSPNFLKFFGLTTDFAELGTTYLFNDISGDGISAENVSRSTFGIKALCRGKMLKWASRTKEPFKLDSYYEFYVTERQYLTPEEAREWQDNPPRPSSLEIRAPEGVMPLDAATMRLVERVEAL